MTDVRLTAVDPTDSQVYPVACNDKGELLIATEGVTDLDVLGNLTVGGTSTFTGEIESLNPSGYSFIARQASGGAAKSSISAQGDAQFERSFVVNAPGGIGSNFKIASFQYSTTETIGFQAGGAANFSGTVTAPNITMSLANTSVSVPQQLVADGFGNGGEVNLLEELIALRLQIKELNQIVQNLL